MASNSDSGIAVWFGLNAGAITFLGVWAYGVVSNEWWMGLIFGWIPASILGVIAGLIVFALMHGVSALAAGRPVPQPGPASDGPEPGVTLQ